MLRSPDLAVGGGDVAAGARRSSRPALRLIPAIEGSEALVRFAQTHVGRAVVLAVYAGLLVLHDRWQMWSLPLALVLPTFFPAHRRKLVGLVTVSLVLLVPPDDFVYQIAYGAHLGGMARRLIFVGVGAAAFAACAGYLVLTGTRAGSFLARRPVATALGLFVASVFVASILPNRGGPLYFLGWVLVAALGHKIWFLCYSVKRRAPYGPLAAIREVSLFQPMWMPNGAVPTPKGGAFLDRIEADGPEALAVCQIKGLKLIAWALLLVWQRAALLALIQHAEAGALVPSYGEALAASAAGAPFPYHVNWLCLAAHFVNKLMNMAIHFHIVIGTCRLAGFRALRGMYRPLEARTLVEFWNRVHFYFKELLVEFFFYPTFIGLKGRTGPRLLVATFAAACLGNFFYHFMRNLGDIATYGFSSALARMQTFALYTVLLALGIWISQLRTRRASKAPDPWYARYRATAVVIGFYCLLGVLDDAGPLFTIRDCARFYLDLLPLRELAAIAAS